MPKSANFTSFCEDKELRGKGFTLYTSEKFSKHNSKVPDVNLFVWCLEARQVL
jgi:hypothetical protein